METQLTTAEINEKQQLLQGYDPAEKALATLKEHDGKPHEAFDKLWSEVNQEDIFGDKKSLWEVTLKVLRQELCGNEGFRGKLNEYIKKPEDAALLTALIISVVQLTTLPINPAIATIIILYILKIGIGIFCEYTEPVADADPTAAKDTLHS
ncbi:hypothetical protein [Argonema galeatum]|uniref:hypothetical protein n=1 Tax=Argonema galeatum TaxID=2942762 RepID=UPI002012A067|nr:hypothetical protein [Argonema galeatum]MCL1467974.1 hypothetical protein [Argonema galeatum A003/A1]